MQETCVQPLGREDPLISWRRKWQPTPVFLPGESQGQRSLAGDSPQVTEELDTATRQQVMLLRMFTCRFLSGHLVESGFPGGSDGKESAAMQETQVQSLGWEGEGDGNPPQHSCLENPRDRGAWRATVPGVAESANAHAHTEWNY